jgi:hypothetical protein
MQDTISRPDRPSCHVFAYNMTASVGPALVENADLH